MREGYDELISVISDQAETIKTQAEEIRRLSTLVALLENDKIGREEAVQWPESDNRSS